MKIFSWNVERRVQTTLGRQIDAVLEREPDVIALQEIKLGTYSDWCVGLGGAGYSIVDSKELVHLPYPPPPYPSPPFPRWRRPHTQIRREPFNLIAAKLPIHSLPGLAFPNADELMYSFPEKYLAARVEVDGIGIDVHNAHLPHGAGRGLVKVHAFEAIRRRVDENPGTPTILCGDFNAPWSESADGPVIEFGGKTPNEDQKRWNEAERRLIVNPQLRDVYRDVHDATDDFPVSYLTGRRAPYTPHRYDYIFASPELVTESCSYLSEWLERDEAKWRLSDHAPVEADLTAQVEGSHVAPRLA